MYCVSSRRITAVQNIYADFGEREEEEEEAWCLHCVSAPASGHHTWKNKSGVYLAGNYKGHI